MPVLHGDGDGFGIGQLDVLEVGDPIIVTRVGLHELAHALLQGQKLPSGGAGIQGRQKFLRHWTAPPDIDNDCTAEFGIPPIYQPLALPIERSVPQTNLSDPEGFAINLHLVTSIEWMGDEDKDDAVEGFREHVIEEEVEKEGEVSRKDTKDYTGNVEN